VKVSPDFVRTEGGELSVEEMYKRTLQEVGSLREQLAERKEYARQSRASEEVMRERVQEVREIVHEEQINKKDIAEGNNVDGYKFRGSLRGRGYVI
jgi:hypothetical protein